MSNKLKLTGVASYMSVLMGNVHILKGDVILVNDDVAGKIGGLHRMSDHDAIKVFFFTEAKAGDEVTYDFTKPETPAQKAPAEVAPKVSEPLKEDAADGVISDSGAADVGAFGGDEEPAAEAAEPAAAPEVAARPVQRARAAKPASK